ncbi:hypothetical protein SASPL_127193 [Salvia splendens]|uniref:Uncharacterized protein n=1 Tax=Salvia splendens TaxID=180675 RepID=A0A8X8XN65_SALSN|nr:hypothetical protein SASPL_127193 [Salvia splendens]
MLRVALRSPSPAFWLTTRSVMLDLSGTVHDVGTGLTASELYKQAFYASCERLSLDFGLGRPVRLTVCTGRLVPSAGDALLALTGRVDFGPITLAFGIGVMINRDSRGHSYFIVRGEILGFMKDEQLRKHLPRMFSLIKNESWGLEDDQIPCSGPHARYTDVFNEFIALADRPSKRESSARVDYVPALCTHRPSLLPIEWSGEMFGSRRRGRFAARDVARSPLNLII